jgi:hypothetical protein
MADWALVTEGIIAIKTTTNKTPNFFMISIIKLLLLPNS